MMSERPMTAGEAEAIFDRAVDALCADYGKPMAAAILEGRARLMTKEVSDALGWSRDAQEAIEIARNIAKLDAFHSIRSDAEKSAAKIARALLSTSASERGMREALVDLIEGVREVRVEGATIVLVCSSRLDAQGRILNARAAIAKAKGSTTSTKDTTNA